MKKAWVEPRIEVQKFVPQEYCAVCPRGWQVACEWQTANSVEDNWWVDEHHNNTSLGVSHGGEHCGTAANQLLIDDDNNGTIDRMIEINSEQPGGQLPCTLYTDVHYTETKALSEVKPGDYIYWTNTNGSVTWHHQGRASEISLGYNHS